MKRSEAVRIPRGEGRPLAGNLHRPDPIDRALGAVLVIHGFKGFKDWGFFPYLCDGLAERGIVALRINLSGCGIRSEGDQFDDSAGFESNTFSTELADIAAALAYLRSRHPDLPMGLMGHSRGGGMAIIHASRDAGVRGLVTWASISHPDRFGPDANTVWERGGVVPVVNARTGQTFNLRPDFWKDLKRNRLLYDIRARAAEISIPWLIVHGSQDETVPVSEALTLHDAATEGRAKKFVRLLCLEGAGHTFDAVHPFAGETEPLRLATDETAAWFLSHLPVNRDPTEPSD